MDFLSKKSWHPSKIQNVEKVWKAEQEAAAEKKKIEELKRKLAEERQIEELRSLQDATGKYKPRVKKVDWLYEQPVSAGTTEEYLFGKKYEGTNSDREEDRKAAESMALFQHKKANAEAEAWNRLKEDPLLAIKQKEKDAIDYIRNNPVRMNQIKEALYKEKKRKREKKKSRSSSSSSKSDRKRKRSSSKRKGESTERKRSTRRHRSPSSSPPRHRDRREKRKGYGLVSSSGESLSVTTKADLNIPDIDDAKRHIVMEQRNERKKRDEMVRRQRREREDRRKRNRSMTPEEREKRLAEMASAGEERDATLKKHIRRMEESDEKAEKSVGKSKRSDSGATFLDDFNKELYNLDVADRVKRNKYYNQRNTEGHGFRRE